MRRTARAPKQLALYASARATTPGARRIPRSHRLNVPSDSTSSTQPVVRCRRPQCRPVAALVLACCWSTAFTQPPRQDTGKGLIEVCNQQAQVSSDGFPDIWCGRIWAIFNKANVREFWEIHEMEMYWDEACTIMLPMNKPVGSPVMTSEKYKKNKPNKAFDMDLDTPFTSNCRYLLGGCAPQTVWLGLDIDARRPQVIHHSSPWAKVRCVRLYQSPNSTRQAGEIYSGVFANETVPGEEWKSFEVLDEYSALSGGYWQRRPAFEQALWRIWNEEATEAPWEVAELIFYTDKFCTRKITGVPISSNTFKENNCIDAGSCDAFMPVNAYNGVALEGRELPEPLPGFWRASCNEYTGCPEHSSWIGVDLGTDPRTVGCFRIWQNAHEGYENPRYSGSLALESWDGYYWNEAGTFSGLGYGGWNSTMPGPFTAWRISNYDKTIHFWKVFEVEFYIESDCGVQGSANSRYSALPGTAINSNPRMSFSEEEEACRQHISRCPFLAVDRQPATAWISSCNPCMQRHAWIGMEFRTAVPAVKCFRLLQSGEREESTEAMELSAWDGEKWFRRRLETSVGGGTWNYRPADPGSSWRLVSISETELPWTVQGLAFYKDSTCIDVYGSDEAGAIACGNTFVNSPDKAFEGFTETEWIAACPPPRVGALGCAPAGAWIGLQAYVGTMDVECIRLMQHPERQRQTSSAALQYWGGAGWLLSKHGVFPELGGGSWQTLPGVRGSMWRFAAEPAAGYGRGVGVAELQFYRKPTCEESSKVVVEQPNVVPITSGYVTGSAVEKATGYDAHRMHIGEFGMTSGLSAFDGNLNTYWADLASGTSWLGIDLTGQVADIACMRLVLVGCRALQPTYAELQGWDGGAWATKAFANQPSQATLLLMAPDVSMMGWTQRPSQPLTVWRLQNVALVSAWEVKELELHETTTCRTSPIPGHPVSSAVTADATEADGGHSRPRLAFDGNTRTLWSAECGAGGCQAGEAWIGLRFDAPHKVMCIRLMQSGFRARQVSTVSVATWADDNWEVHATYTGLGGDTWNVRPAAPNTMWRVSFVKRQEEECSGERRPNRNRVWGVTELKFYADDSCRQLLPGPEDGADIIASGAAVPSGTQGSKNPFDPANAFDGSTLTRWGAQCGLEGSREASANCKDGADWIGMDFTKVTGGLPIEVRCMSLHQSRSEGVDCCDPAEEVRLDRWNGTHFVPAFWQHVGSDDVRIQVEGNYGRLAICPAFGSAISSAAGLQLTKPEQRDRRQADRCEIPLTGAVLLLSDALCQKHPLCQAAGFLGQCCPMDSESAISRCCCKFLAPGQTSVFEDEMLVGLDRNPLKEAPVIGVEYIIIHCTRIMPIIGVIFGIGFYYLALLETRGPNDCCYRFYLVFSKPIKKWLQTNSPLAQTVSFFVTRQPKEKAISIYPKRLFGLLALAYVAGCSPWILIACLFARVFLLCLGIFNFVIRKTTSPYNPKEKSDRKRMAAVLGIPFDPDASTEKIDAGSIGEFFADVARSIAMGIAYAIKSVFDIIFMRFAAMSVGMTDVSLPIPALLNFAMPFPSLQPFVDAMYQLSTVFETLFLELAYAMFVGVPRCEGPVLIFSGMWLITVTVFLIQTLNYDYFGIFRSSKAVVSKTRPKFQKMVLGGVVAGIQTALFMVMQCVMLLFSRAITLVSLNPFETRSTWTCPHAGEDIAKGVGRIFLVVTAVTAISITFLVANGHFIGMPFVTEPLSKCLSFDLSPMNPKPSETFFGIRLTTTLALVPTTLGIWIDGWNIKSYLIKERATIYATELRFPETCPHCGGSHIPYWEVMRATAQQLSLAYQLVPFGAIIGKGCEYMNNPPMFYGGKALTCYYKCKNIQATRDGMPKKPGTPKESLKYNGALLAARVQDQVVPTLKRCLSVLNYGLLIYCTFFITKENIDTVAMEVFKLIYVVSTLKAYAEIAFPALFAIVVVALLIKTGRRKPKNKPMYVEMARLRRLALTGMIVESVLPGIGAALFLQNQRSKSWSFLDISDKNALLLGTVVGGLNGYLMVVLAWLLEKFPGSRLSSTLYFAWLNVIWSAAIGVGVGLNDGIRVQVVMGVCAAVLMVPTGAASFNYGKPLKDREIPPQEKGQPKVHRSALYALVATFRYLSGFMGLVGGVHVGVMPSKILIDSFGTYTGLGLSGGLGLFFGFVFGFPVDTVIDKRAGKWAVGSAIIVSLPLGILLHPAIGVFFGGIVGAAAGMIVERFETKAAMEGNFEDRVLTSGRGALPVKPPVLQPFRDVAPPKRMSLEDDDPLAFLQDDLGDGGEGQNNLVLFGDLGGALVPAGGSPQDNQFAVAGSRGPTSTAPGRTKKYGFSKPDPNKVFRESGPRTPVDTPTHLPRETALPLGDLRAVEATIRSPSSEASSQRSQASVVVAQTLRSGRGNAHGRKGG